MSIVLFLGRSVKEYKEENERIIEGLIKAGNLRCELCTQPMKRHSGYERGIKETGERLSITMVWCKECRKWHALLPDFLLPRKHYSGNEIESVIIDSVAVDVSEIETEASESTVRRWIVHIGERMEGAYGVLKYLFNRAGRAIGELTITAGTTYNELEQLLEMAPKRIKSSGNKLGLVNLWIGTTDNKAYI